VHSPICKAIKEGETCVRAVDCSWNDENQECAADMFKLYYKFTKEDYVQTIGYKSPQYIEDFTEHVDPTSPSFDWQSILDWKPQPTDCPEASQPLVCDFTDVVLATLVPTMFYCQLRYSGLFQFPSCLRDPVCDYDFLTLSCTAHESIGRKAVIEAFEATNPFVEHEIDRELITASINCYKIANMTECTGSCTWSPTDEGCDSSDSLTFQALSKPGEGGDDPVCTYFSTVGSSACVDIEYQEECDENTNCAWKVDEECWPTAAYLIRDVTLRDKAIGGSYRQLQERCAGYSTHVACNSGLLSVR